MNRYCEGASVEPHSATLVTTLFAVFAAAICGGLVARKLRLPLLVGYIATGILFGNIGTRFIDAAFLERIGDTGVTLLLFTLGVEFSFHRLQKILVFIIWAATAQILLSLVAFLFLLLAIGFPFVPALFFSIAFALSSTAVVVKLLTERGELDTVPGELATAWLVIQDLAVVPIMIILPALVSTQLHESVTLPIILTVTAFAVVKSAVVLGLIFFLGRFGVPKLLSRLAGLANRELFLMTTVGLVFAAALLSYAFGLSAALGAFIAGLLVSETSQNHAIFSEIRPLRDLFAVIFFVTLGMVVPAATFVRSGGTIVLLACAIIGIKGFLVYGLSRFLGYHRKAAFLVAIGLTQVSEFGFIIAREGVRLHALNSEQYVLLTAVTFVTISISAPMFSRGYVLYHGVLSIFGRFWPKIFPVRAEHAEAHEDYPIRDHVVICGYGRVGKYIGRALEMAHVPFLVIDYNGTTITELKNRGIPVIYGDPADKEVLDYAQVDVARALVIAIPDRHTQEMIIGNARSLQRRLSIICRSHHEEDQARLKSLGVTLIIQPEFEAALAIVTRLLPVFGVPQEDISGKIARLKIEHGIT